MSFDEYAKNWDTDIRIKRAKVISNEIIKSIDIREGYRAMEFGCGTGLISFNIYDEFKDVTLVDSSQGMIDIVKDKITKYEINNMTPCKIDLLNEEFTSKNFDVIFSSMVLHHIEDTSKIIKKFYELLNTEGTLCIVDLDKEDGSFHKNEPDFRGHNGFEQEELKNILLKNSFKDIEVNTFYKDKKVIDDKEIGYSLFLLKARKY
ncbi:class I SAM-dependent methyltransferase [Clostridium sp. 'White wine YQ']|uniref:class I SAM-dependent methyltransferase n=1 Tax=Clostridium sp. 'White wine YQ' TaxID=3027474 RepID=UPI0023650475|nr:class I SAM-dependent methyltransferase [Clostridium sp. 'White wine YQ']MDD7793161.1 class I SAM-dependent methyltransferase [Clostridium sp. 'White wine YQ']